MEFCNNTFRWGDYIHEVWDTWYSDRNGALMVAEIKSNNIGVNHTKSTMTAAAPEHRISSITTQVVGVSHAYVCPKRKQVWLEGIRVNPKYRRTGIASQLLDQMIKYGKGIDSNIGEATAIAAQTNAISRSMLVKNDFQERAKWTYYTGYKENDHQGNRDGVPIRKYILPNNQGEVPNDNASSCSGNTGVSFATANDIDNIISFLSRSRTFISSGKRYVQSWKWYELDLEHSSISALIACKKIIIVRTRNIQEVEGLAITNNRTRENYQTEQLQSGNQRRKQVTSEEADSVNRADEGSFQIVYLDAPTLTSLENLLGFIVNWTISSSKFDRIQLFTPNQIHPEKSDFYDTQDVLAKFGISRSECFLLYVRSI